MFYSEEIWFIQSYEIKRQNLKAWCHLLIESHFRNKFRFALATSESAHKTLNVKSTIFLFHDSLVEIWKKFHMEPKGDSGQCVSIRENKRWMLSYATALFNTGFKSFRYILINATNIPADIMSWTVRLFTNNKFTKWNFFHTPCLVMIWLPHYKSQASVILPEIKLFVLGTSNLNRCKSQKFTALTPYLPVFKLNYKEI